MPSRVREATSVVLGPRDGATRPLAFGSPGIQWGEAEVTAALIDPDEAGGIEHLRLLAEGGPLRLIALGSGWPD
jgi:hypothetical protein